MNLLAQPPLVLTAFLAIRKLFFGFSGRVGYAGREIPEEELRRFNEKRRWSFVCYGILQGLVMLPFAVWLSVACVLPLLFWAR
jgi:hypothetical protein